ncbi:hypothetical protein Goarm_013075, partial [Gossypium armourianum]|nr:hypothetical protein [Gossypium armourianum]
MVIRLLGRNIRYKDLMNRILLMWKPSRDFQLVGLDNDHVLVKFRNKANFDKVFIKGLWGKAGKESIKRKEIVGNIGNSSRSRFKFLGDKDNEALFEENFMLIGEAIEKARDNENLESNLVINNIELEVLDKELGSPTLRHRPFPTNK